MDAIHNQGTALLCTYELSVFYAIENRYRTGTPTLLQSEIRPLTISHGTNSPRTDKTRFQLEFEWTGTDDPTAYICVPEVMSNDKPLRVYAFMGSLLPGGWTELMQQNHHLVLQGRRLLCEALEVQPPCPEEMIGSMAVVPLPTMLENRDFMSWDKALHGFWSAAF